MGEFMRRMTSGSTGRHLSDILRRETAQDVTHTNAGSVRLPKNAETSVLISTGDSLASRDRSGTKQLLRRQRDLIKAAHASFDAMRRLSTARAHARWVNEGAVERDADAQSRGDPRHGEKFREMFDPHHPMISERALLIIEVVFVIVEFGFWYGVVFSGNIPAHASLFDVERVTDILLSVMIPLSGIVAARIVGTLTHRMMRRYPGTGTVEVIGAVMSITVAGFAVYAIYYLVHSRFSATTLSSLGAFSPPALAITIVFVVVLVGDMVARIFLVSEIRAQSHKWHRQVEGLAASASRANLKHCHAWVNLRDATQRQLDLYERVVAAGARLISDDRSRNEIPIPAPELPAASAEIRRAHEQEGDHTPAASMAVPSVESLKLFGAYMVHVPLRVVEDSIDTLRNWLPRHQKGLTTELGGMVERLHYLSPAFEDANDEQPETQEQEQERRFGPFEPEVPPEPAKPAEPATPPNGADHKVDYQDVGESEGT